MNAAERCKRGPTPAPGPGEVRLGSRPAASAAPTCTSSTANSPAELPIVPGHEIVGLSSGRGRRPEDFGARVGVAWLGHTCGHCRYCGAGARTSATRPPSPAIRATAAMPPIRSPTPLLSAAAADLDPVAAAPLLCAGLIGCRSLEIRRRRAAIGIYGFGAAAHIIAQVAASRGGESTPSPGRATPPRRSSRARSAPAGRADRTSRRPSRWTPRSFSRRSARSFRAALRRCARAACRLRRHPHERHPVVSLSLLWGERSVVSVANLTRADGRAFLSSRRRRGANDDDALPARRRQPGARRFARAAGSRGRRCWWPEGHSPIGALGHSRRAPSTMLRELGSAPPPLRVGG